MDDRRFDSLARMVIGHANRRSALRAIVAAFAFGVGARDTSTGAAKDRAPTRRCKGKRKRDCCKRDRDCRNRNPDPCVGGQCVGGRCAFFAVRCAAGYVCCGNASCCPT